MLLNTSIVPGFSPFDAPLDQAEVLAAPGTVGIKVESLNGGSMPGYHTTPSAQNDYNILNFALFLEYLEQDFYNINVPKFFG